MATKGRHGTYPFVLLQATIYSSAASGAQLNMEKFGQLSSTVKCDSLDASTFVPLYDCGMKQKGSPEYARFSTALKKVLQVSHTEMQARIEAAKRERQQRRKRTSADHASREKD
jgi:hypothetical protein